jgi:hypothetical protein
VNLVTIIENVELERTNNKNLGEAIESRLQTLGMATDALLSQASAFVDHLKKQQEQIANAVNVSRQEFADRDAALAALIGGGE